MSGGGQACIHPAIEGLDVRVSVRGRPVKAVVAREILEEHFAAAAHPQGWLESYRRNAPAIDGAIARRWREEQRQPVILRPGDL